MKRYSQHGVALVITLIMLAVVTLMAITFLAISRRERASVQVTQDQTDARTMADAGLARAEAQAVARMVASSNPLNYGLLVSTNFVNAAGFWPGLSSVTNVNYNQLVSGQPLSEPDRIRNIGNLFYSPRPPVYVDTNGNGAFDFRFYLDLNRNGRFESNGLQVVLNPLGYPVSDTNRQPLTNFFVGDPEWVGVLERPDLPHSGTNRFLGRYAYIALPMGKSLDLNFIHNQAKRRGPLVESYFRNQGVGSWEINLAAFLCDLNTNIWGGYTYHPNPGFSSAGIAFDDAATLVQQRYAGNFANLASANLLLGPSAAAAFGNGRIDAYANGPLMTGAYPPPLPPNDTTKPWSGSDNPQNYYDAQQLFSLTNGAAPGLANPLATITRRLVTAGTAGRSSYDRYTFYRLLGQMGVDSTPSLAGKMNLNFTNDAAGTMTNLVSWTPLGFFTNAVNRLLQGSLITNVIYVATARPILTNFFIGDTLVRSNISATDIQLFPTNEYSSSVHRLLQLAANLYDATTNRPNTTYPYLPSVFRPIFRRTATNVIVSGFTEETNALFLSDARLDLAQLAARPPGVYSNVLLYGQPLVIGAKKGFPNLNEWNCQTSLRITRKLELVKPNTNSLPTVTNQMYLLGVTNLAGVEAWNSYSTNYPRQLVLHVEDRCTVRVGNQFGGSLLFNNTGTVANLVMPPTGLNAWRPLQFKVPISTNFMILSNATYTPVGFTNVQQWEPGLNRGEPIWTFSVTNRLIYYLLDVNAGLAGRVVDYASFSSVQQETNVIERVRELLQSRNNIMARFWLLGPNGNTVPGITNQILASMGRIPLDNNMWTSASLNPYTGYDKNKAMAFFEYFLTGTTTGTNRAYDIEARRTVSPWLRAQTPFNPSPILYYVERGQANDPLVHYLLADLRPGLSTNAWPADPVPYFELGTSNKHFNAYSPWGRPYAVYPNITIGPTNFAFKDPMVRSSDDWNFPSNKFPTIGWIGRVHRGTPWQTVYLKPSTPDLSPLNWLAWSGNVGSNPTNDWRLLDWFTVAPNANAARGLLSVNQTNLAAWSAVLSGVNVLSNSFIQPNGYVALPALLRGAVGRIVDGINRTRSTFPQQTFQHMGDVLATPELSVASPFLNLVPFTNRDDVAYERIPQQILSLLKPDEPRLVIYSFGQSLKPADRSLIMEPGPNFRLCTNYQITAEVVTRTVLRVDGGVKNPRVVVESYSILPTD